MPSGGKVDRCLAIFVRTRMAQQAASFPREPACFASPRFTPRFRGGLSLQRVLAFWPPLPCSSAPARSQCAPSQTPRILCDSQGPMALLSHPSSRLCLAQPGPFHAGEAFLLHSAPPPPPPPALTAGSGGALETARALAGP